MLRSLVRENRTQGSVRGRSGNRPSYLDVKKKEQETVFEPDHRLSAIPGVKVMKA